MARILICGATGFIGRNLAEYFAQHSDLPVHAVYHMRPHFHHPRITWHQVDLRNAETVNALIRKGDIVLQAAASTSGAHDIVNNPALHVTDNAVMNSLIFRAAADAKARHVIFFSCSVMYPSRMLPQSEEDFDPSLPLHPRYFGVGHTKLYCEKLCEFYASLGDTKFTALRHSNSYGPHDKFDFARSHVMGATISKVMTAEHEVVVWGRGEEARDLLYIDDLIACVKQSIEHQQQPFRLYNCGSGQAVRISDLVEKIIMLSGKGLTIRYDDSKPSIPTSVSLNCNRAHQELHWTPKISLDEGILRTLTWWEAHIHPQTLLLRAA